MATQAGPVCFENMDPGSCFAEDTHSLFRLPPPSPGTRLPESERDKGMKRSSKETAREQIS